MKRTKSIIIISLITLFLSLIWNDTLFSCSTFKLQKGNELIYGHNLNEGDIGVSGMVFINKRGIFKCGRTWNEMYKKKSSDTSAFSWISRYGSVTFNNFGKDFPDGGMNEAGLYIWEMNESADYPKSPNLPKLFMMNWIQYVLDNCLTVEDAIQSASQFQIDGWTWHYFISDGSGNCASLAFIDGKVKTESGEKMKIPALFNEPYNREMELLRYYKGFGGFYDISLNDPKIPRFVKTAAMIRDYEPSTNAVDYGFYMLDKIAVNDEPEWSVIFDALRQKVYFKTRLNPKIKMFSMNSCDFSNKSPVQILDIDLKQEGDALKMFHSYSNDEFRNFLEKKLIPIVPEDFFTGGGLTLKEFAERFSSQGNKSEQPAMQYFTGVWETKKAYNTDGISWKLILWTKSNAVNGEITNSRGYAFNTPIEHLSLLGDNLCFTFRTKEGTLYEIKGNFHNNQLKAQIFGIEDNFGEVTLMKTGI